MEQEQEYLNEYRCKIIRVIDGDTVDIDIDLGFDIILSNQRVRLYGIDTPESRTSDDVEKVFGNLSKDFVKHALPVGSYQTLRTNHDATGKFGRILGEFMVTVDGRRTTINEEMIKRNLAVRYFGQSKEEIVEEHLANRKILEERGMSYGSDI